MNNRGLILFSLILSGCCLCELSFAQVDSADAKKRKKDPRAVAKSWDKNKNGILEASEIPAERRDMVAAWARKKGQDPNKPIELEKLLAKQDTKLEKEAKKAARKAAKDKPEAGSDEKTPSSTRRENSKAFGTSAKAKKQQRPDSNETKNGEESEKKRDGRNAARLAARSLMYQNDRNKNKRLEKAEWSRLKGDPSKADVDKDGSLSMDELTDHLAGYGSREEKPQPKYRQRKKRVSTGKGKKSYRFLTPHERLPEGLPDWFVDRDANFDGQLSLKEFAPSLTAAKYKKFAQLDLNKDGLLVAKEYLSATK